MAPRKKPTPKKRRYVVKQVNAVEYAETIAQLLSYGFDQASQGPTAFIGTSWWIAFEVLEGGILEPVGCGGMLHSAIEENTFYLNRSYVDKEHRGHGLQRSLIKARVARARELGGVYATSDTYDNPHSANNLIACGFRAYNPESRWRAPATMYWRLALGPTSPRRLKL